MAKLVGHSGPNTLPSSCARWRMHQSWSYSAWGSNRSLIYLLPRGNKETEEAGEAPHAYKRTGNPRTIPISFPKLLPPRRPLPSNGARKEKWRAHQVFFRGGGERSRFTWPRDSQPGRTRRLQIYRLDIQEHCPHRCGGVRIRRGSPLPPVQPPVPARHLRHGHGES